MTEPNAWSYVVEEAQLDPAENHRTLSFDNPEDDRPEGAIQSEGFKDATITEKTALYSEQKIVELIDEFYNRWIHERVNRSEDLKDLEMSPHKASAVHRFAEDLIEKISDDFQQKDGDTSE